jgi:hypothetical protein
MTAITIRDGQSIFDIALQFYGDVSGALKVVQDNGLANLNAQLYGGQTIFIDEAFTIDEALATYFRQQEIIHNTSTPTVIEGSQFDDSFDNSFA